MAEEEELNRLTEANLAINERERFENVNNVTFVDVERPMTPDSSKNSANDAVEDTRVPEMVSTPPPESLKSPEVSSRRLPGKYGRISMSFDEENAHTELGSTRDKTIDEMRIKTMYRMVEDVPVLEGGVETEKKVLYLTNKQATMFDEEGLARCIEALDLGEPKCIIRLCEAWNTVKEYQVLINHQKLEPGQFGHLDKLGGTLSIGDAITTEKELALFMKNHLLPLAKETRALIIINSGSACAMGNALRMTFMGEVERLGADCPFKVIGFGAALTYTYNACKGIGTVGQVCRGSESYSYRMEAITMHEMRDETELENRDLNPVCSHYIIVEGIDFSVVPSKADRGALYKFSNMFIKVLGDSLPSIAIATARSLPYQTLNTMAKNGVPLLLLDLRQRAFTMRKRTTLQKPMDLCQAANQFPSMKVEEVREMYSDESGELAPVCKGKLMEIAKDMLRHQWDTLADAHTVDRWDICTLAFFHAVLHTGMKDFHAPQAASTALHACIARMQMDNAEMSTADSEHTLERLGAVATDFIVNDSAVYAHKAHLARMKNWLNRHDSDFDYLEEKCHQEISRKEKLMSAVAEGGGVLPLATTDIEGALSNKDIPETQSPSDWQAVHELLMSSNVYSASIHDTSEIQRIFSRVAKIDRLPEANSLESNLTIQDAWDHVDLYYACSSLYKRLTKVVYAALLLVGILITWAANSEDLRYAMKKDLIMFLSLGGTILAGYVNFMNPGIKWQQLRGAAMSIESHIWMFRTRACEYRVVGRDDFDSSALQTLKMNIDYIKSNVMEGADIKSTNFFGRTSSPNRHNQHPPVNGRAFGHRDNLIEGRSTSVKRVHPDRDRGKDDDDDNSDDDDNDDDDDDDNDDDGDDIENGKSGRRSSGSTVKPRRQHLRVSKKMMHGKRKVYIDVVLRLINNLAGGASVTSESYDRAGSFGGSGGDEIDTSYMPLQPDKYCIFRIERALMFYKERLPRCNRTRYIGHIIITLGSITGVLLAVFDALEFAAVIAIFVSSMTAWMEFSGTQSKITRYSTTIGALQDLLLWWRTCEPIERSSTWNIDRLISTTEDILRTEVNAWASTSQAAKVLAKAIGPHQGESESEAMSEGINKKA